MGRRGVASARMTKVALAWLLLATGCYRSYGNHVSFPPLPSPDAPAPVRESAYLELRSTAVRDDDHFRLTGGPSWYPPYRLRLCVAGLGVVPCS
jgi:hypothetical protein